MSDHNPAQATKDQGSNGQGFHLVHYEMNEVTFSSLSLFQFFDTILWEENFNQHYHHHHPQQMLMMMVSYQYQQSLK